MTLLAFYYMYVGWVSELLRLGKRRRDSRLPWGKALRMKGKKKWAFLLKFAEYLV